MPPDRISDPSGSCIPLSRAGFVKSECRRVQTVEVIKLPRRQNSRKTPQYSFNNISVLKRAIYYYGPQTADELADQIRAALPYAIPIDEALNRYVEPPLRLQKYFVRLEDGRWDIDWAMAGENQFVEKVLLEEGHPLSLREIRARVAALLAKNSEDVRIDLDSDPNFVPIGSEYYGLSAWHVMNDEAYEFLSRRPGVYRSERDITDSVIAESGLVRDAVTFCPKLDPRFMKGPNGTWGLAAWETKTRAKEKALTPPVGDLVPIRPTSAQMNRVAMLADTVTAYLRALRTSVRPGHLVEVVVGVSISSPEYPAYVKVMNSFLSEHQQFLRVGSDLWRLREQVPQEVWDHSAEIAVPRVREHDLDLVDATEKAGQSFPARSMQENRKHQPTSFRTALSLVHWRNGTARIPSTRLKLSPSDSEQIVEIRVQVWGQASQTIDAWYSRTAQTLFGLRQVYDHLGTMPGAILQFSTLGFRMDYLILRWNGEVDPAVELEQSRLVDLVALHQTAARVKRTFRSILISVMESHPEGLRFREIFREVTQIRPVAIATIRTLLSELPCLRPSPEVPGLWQYDPSQARKVRGRSFRRVRVASVARRPGPIGVRTSSGSIVSASDKGGTVFTHSASSPPPTPEQAGIVAIDPDSEQSPPAGAPLKSVKERVASLLSEGVTGDKALIREYLARYHHVDIPVGFLSDSVPPPESVRRARQALVAGRVNPENLDMGTVVSRVKSVLDDAEIPRDDKHLTVEYYRRFHYIEVPAEYLGSDVPVMETIRRCRQLLTSPHKNQLAAPGDHTTVGAAGPETSSDGIVRRLQGSEEAAGADSGMVADHPDRDAQSPWVPSKYAATPQTSVPQLRRLPPLITLFLRWITGIARRTASRG